MKKTLFCCIAFSFIVYSNIIHASGFNEPLLEYAREYSKDKYTLSDICGFLVITGFMSEDAKKIGLSRISIQNKAIDLLQKHGIPVGLEHSYEVYVSKLHFKDIEFIKGIAEVARPMLNITVLLHRIPDVESKGFAVYIFKIEIEFIQGAFLANGNLQMVPTWKDGVWGTVLGNVAKKETIDTVMLYVEKFAEDYLQANNNRGEYDENSNQMNNRTDLPPENCTTTNVRIGVK